MGLHVRSALKFHSTCYQTSFPSHSHILSRSCGEKSGVVWERGYWFPTFFHIARVGEPGVDLRRKVAEFVSSHKNEAVFSLKPTCPPLSYHSYQTSHTTVLNMHPCMDMTQNRGCTFVTNSSTLMVEGVHLSQTAAKKLNNRYVPSVVSLCQLAEVVS